MNAMAMPEESVGSERRLRARKPLAGPAVLMRKDGYVVHVDFVDLSAGGACVTRPPCGISVGDRMEMMGATMPWERQAKVVALSPRGVHLAFVDAA